MAYGNRLCLKVVQRLWGVNYAAARMKFSVYGVLFLINMGEDPQTPRKFKTEKE